MILSSRLLILLLVAPIILVSSLRFDMTAGKTKVSIYNSTIYSHYRTKLNGVTESK